MTLNSSGPISLGGATVGQSVNLEIGNVATAQISFNDSAVRTLTGTVAGTALVMPTGFYGKSSGFTLTYLVVGGGGAGGYSAGGGGGGGQVLSGTTAVIACGASKTYTITVGTGGTADTSGSNGTAGGASSITAAGFTTLSAVGGGYGGSTARAAGAGASGGGGGTLYGSTGGGSATAGSAGGSGFALPVVTWVSPAAGSSIGTFTQGAAISAVTLSATATAGTVQYTVSAGALPTGLTLGLTTGQITGTPSQTGSAQSFTVSAVSSLGGSAVTRSFTWTVNAPVTTWSSPADGSSIGSFTSGTAISPVQLTATATAGTVQYTVSAGALPTGLSLGLTTGQITGTPSQTGSAVAFTVSAVSSLGGSAATRSFTWTVNTGASYLIVAGGGAGGNNSSGGGGAGGMLTGTTALAVGTTYTVIVGAGGATSTGGSGSNGGSGGNSSFTGLTTAVGGGGGGGYQNNGLAGGSGGGGAGANSPTTGGSPTACQGYAGGGGISAGGRNPSGGGGGAGGAGGNATGCSSSNDTGGAGGAGRASSISGVSTYYAGGGGGAGEGGRNGGGGAGGGGAGYCGTSRCGYPGCVNTGGGGGGVFNNRGGGSGGSGVVIVSYAGSTPQFSGGAVTLAGGNVIHTFRNSGYLTGSQLLTKSLRFRSSASAYLNRTPASASNRQTWTWSGWVKLGALNPSSGWNAIFGAYSDDNNRTFFYTNNNIVSNAFYFFNVTGGTATCTLISTQVLRDPSAWYHLVVSVDTTQGTSTNRVKIYLNGSQITSFGTATYPSSSANFMVNNNVAHYIGASNFSGLSLFHDGYMTEVNLIDGQALTPNYFGTFNQYGTWQPIAYAGTYGNNGFYLPFTNTTSTTTLGYDSSGNANNWTPNNISLTAGSTYDSMTDVPTLTSATAANYAVLNPLVASVNGATLNNGNLQFVSPSSSAQGLTTATMGVSSGKWYWEQVTSSDPSSAGSFAGILLANAATTGYVGSTSSGYSYYNSGSKYNNSTPTAYGASWGVNDTIGVALDMDGGTITFYKNGVSQGTAFTGLVGTFMPAVSDGGTGSLTMNINFGQQPFVYTPPTGFLALNTYNI